jgi:adenylylsulfate kinase
METLTMAWAIWMTGLPGSGKSSITKQFVKLYPGKVQVLRMDEFRRFLTPEQEYNETERQHAYRAMVLAGKFLVENDINVIFDATGHRREFRDLARNNIENFKEIYIKCNLKTAMQREANRKNNLVVKNLYQKALKRLEGEKVELVGEMIGIDVPYEEPEKPELVVESEKTEPTDAAKQVLELIE